MSIPLYKSYTIYLFIIVCKVCHANAFTLFDDYMGWTLLQKYKSSLICELAMAGSSSNLNISANAFPEMEQSNAKCRFCLPILTVLNIY